MYDVTRMEVIAVFSDGIQSILNKKYLKACHDSDGDSINSVINLKQLNKSKIQIYCSFYNKSQRYDHEKVEVNVHEEKYKAIFYTLMDDESPSKRT